MGQDQQQTRSQFKAPEGSYSLYSDKHSTCNFNAHRPVRLTFATLQYKGEPQHFVIYNQLDALAFAHYTHTEKAPARQIFVGSGQSSSSIYPTCHSHQASLEGHDLVIGLTSGDVVVGSTKAQLQASQANTKLLSLLHFNPEGSVDATRAVDVAWIPGTNATVFAAAHQSGNIYLYQTQSATAPAANTASSGGKPGPAVVPRPALTIPLPGQELNSMSVSPDGTKLASATKGGLLYVHDSSTGQLLGGFKSHFGGLTCCAWSHDSRYIATGGEDDLVCVYGLSEQAVVFWGQGHSSWITRVAFDRWESEQGTSLEPLSPAGYGSPGDPLTGPEQTRYRIASVGQDCRLLLWDFTVEEADFSDELDFTTAPPQPTDVPRGVHRRTSSSGPTANGGVSTPSAAGEASRRPHTLPPEIAPPVRRAEMFLSAPVTSTMVHMEPCTDLLFMKDAIFTASSNAQIRCWARPRRVAAATTPSHSPRPATTAGSPQPHGSEGREPTAAEPRGSSGTPRGDASSRSPRSPGGGVAPQEAHASPNLGVRVRAAEAAGADESAAGRQPPRLATNTAAVRSSPPERSLPSPVRTGGNV